jgi:ubiquinone/menaquinone biosynthesis C-methylase UbiE
MLEDRSREIENIRKKWDEHAERYDKWYERFNGAVEHYVDWELLKAHLPKDRNAKILDAAGGTGRITLPLAKMGYSVTLCDISPGMLNVAKQKMRREGVSDKVKILECNVYKLRFADESFDFVLCWDGKIEAAKELIRVTKKGGKISMFLINKYGAAIRKFHEDPGSALALVKSKSSYTYDEEEKYKVVNVEEARELFEKEGVKVIEIHAVCGMLDTLSIPKKIQESRSWDEKFFNQATQMLLRLSKEPSVKGLSKHLVFYGEKI